MGDAAGAVAALLPGVRIDPVEWLRQTQRSEVLRVRAVRPGRSEPEMLIVKLFPDASEGWVRESAALAAAPAGHRCLVWSRPARLRRSWL